MRLTLATLTCSLLLATTVIAEEAGPLRPLPSKPAHTALEASRHDDRVIVKFAEATALRWRENRWTAADAVDLSALETVTLRFGPAVGRLASIDEATIDAIRAEGERRTGSALPDLNLYHELSTQGPHGAALCDALNALEVVELCYLAPLPAPPPGDIAPVTPDFRANQGYPLVAPGGINARYAWNFPGGRGEETFIVDIEYDWYDTHEDLTRAAGRKLAFTPNGNYPEHGTAVLGEMIGDDDRWGVTGLVPEATVGMITQDPVGLSNSVARAIIEATARQDAGDVMLLEAQTFGPTFQYVPVEWNQAEYDAIVAATAKGIVVVEAAGNGSQNLDSATYLNRFNRSVRDSRAIIVGAGATPSSGQADRSRLSFSTYGSRLDAQGWGEWVTTTGYGGAWAGDAVHRQDYTTSFNGTSSASPIVASAAAALQSVRAGRGEAPLTPLALRQLITDTGTAQQSGPFSGAIGPRPDLRAALRKLATLIYDSHELNDPAPGGNGDATVDPGETVRMRLCLYNATASPVNTTRLRLMPPAPWVRVIADEALIGTVPVATAACSASDEYRMVIDPAAPCGAAVRFPLAITSSAGPVTSWVRLVVGRDGSCTPQGCATPQPSASVAQLTVVEVGADLRLDWNGLAGASDYRIWRALDPSFADPRFVKGPDAPGGTSALLAGAGASSGGALELYQVRAINACGWEGP